jgi:DNA-binding GntR family transcriptional regulator
MTSFTAPVTRREAVLHQLRQEILTGVLPAGCPVRDVEVASRLGVSITPVREAITQLGVEGYIDISPNRRRVVTTMDRHDALELIDVMRVLTCAGFSWSVARLTSAHLASLRGLLADYGRLLDEGEPVAAWMSGAAFSTELIAPSGNRELLTHVGLVVARSQRVMAIAADPEVWRIWRTGYHDVLELLESDSRDAAVDRYAQIYPEFRTRIEHTRFPEGPGGAALSG